MRRLVCSLRAIPRCGLRSANRRLHVNKSKPSYLDKLDQEQVDQMHSHVLIPVDRNDNVVKTKNPLSKLAAHRYETAVLHRAFSVFLFTPDMEKLLLQKRAPEKITFPELWTNTCCSHPHLRDDEKSGIEGVKLAASRRLKFELNLDVEPESLEYKCKVLYQAAMDTPAHPNQNPQWMEKEMDYLLIGKIPADSDIQNFNKNEVESVTLSTFDDIFCQADAEMTPWFREIRNRGLLESMWKNPAFTPDDGSRILDFIDTPNNDPFDYTIRYSE